MGPQRPRRRQGQKCSSSTTTSTTTKRTKITTDLLMTEESKWKAHYQQLQAYHEANGHSQVPSGTSTSENPDLYLWMMTQRRLYRDDCLSRERIDLLNQLQFAWNMPRVSSSSSSSSSTSSSNNSSNKNAKWQAMYRQFQRHQTKQQQEEQEEHGRTQKMGGPLAKWVFEQQQNRDNMSPSHRDLLDQIAFPWNEVEEGAEAVMDQQEEANPRTTTTRTTTHQEEENSNATFEDMFQELADFRDDHGHQCVPINTPLGLWCRQLRMAYQKGQVTAQHRERLAGIDFIWDEAKVQQERDEWNLYFDKLQAYQQSKGHTYVQREDDLPLWRWSERNDWMQRRGTLPKHRNDRLDSIGFWDPPPLDYSIERGEETATTTEKENVVSVNKKGNTRTKTKATSKAKGATTRKGTKRSNLKRKQKGGNRKSSATRKSGNRDSLANDEEEDEAASNANATLRDNDGDDGDERQQPKNKGTFKSAGKRTPSTRSGERRAKQNVKEEEDTAQRPVRKSTRLSSHSTSDNSNQEDQKDEKPAAKRKRSNNSTSSNTKRPRKEGDDNDEVEEPAKASRPKRTRKGPDLGAGNNQQMAGEQDHEEGNGKSSSRGRRESAGSSRRRTHVDKRAPHEQESKDDSVFRTPYQVGTKVMKRFGSHGWFSGEIISIYQENVFKIRYEDHDEETYQLPEEKASLDKIIANAIQHGIVASPVVTKKVGTVDAAANEIFQVGTPVKTFFTGHGWFDGTIEMVKRNAIKVVYEDGDEETYEMPKEKKEMQEIVCNAKKLCYAVGTAVKKHFKRHGWFKGQIVGMEEDRYKIQYEDGDKEDYLFETELQQLDQIVWNAKSQQ